MTVVVVGPVMHDVVAVLEGPLQHGGDTPAQLSTRGGGAGANVAAWLASTGTPTVLVGRVGSDTGGETELTTLAALGVRLHVHRDQQRRTGTCVVLVSEDGQRSMLPDQGANAALAPADIPAEEFTAGRHLHLSGYVLFDQGSRHAGLRALALAARAGMTVSVDPASAAPVLAVGAQTFLSWVTGAELLFPNEDEARALAGGDASLPAALDVLGRRFGTVVCTRGAQGADLVCRLENGDSRRERADSLAVPAVDSTGAGDAFVAGFLPRWLAGEGARAALDGGCALAGRAVQQVGARPT